MPLLTIGLPVYNDAPYLEQALRSLFAQTLSDWELIAVDDGSSDGSADILQRLQNPRVRVLVDGRHLGLGARLNQIAQLASGHYVARMDADDLSHPARMERQVRFLEEHAEVDVVGCGLVSFDRDLRPVSMRLLPAEHEPICAQPERGVRLAHASTVARAEWLRRYRYAERSPIEDWELWSATYRESRFANLAQALYFYRELETFRLGGYARSKARMARVYWRERRRLGVVRAAGLAAGEYLRVAAYAAASAAGLQESLVRRRGIPVPPEVATEFQAAVGRIRATPLPGIDAAAAR